MTATEIRALAEANDVILTVDPLAFGRPTRVEAWHPPTATVVAATNADPDRAVVAAIEACAWRATDGNPDGGWFAWAFDRFGEDGRFPVEWSS